MPLGLFNKYNFQVIFSFHGIITKENAFEQWKVMTQSQTLSKWYFSRFQTWL